MTGETPQRFSPPRLRDEGWLVGELVAHGAANYLNDPNNSASYYVRIRTLETEEGARRAVRAAAEAHRTVDGESRPLGDTRESGVMRIAWGKDLERAIKQSKSHVEVGHIVGLRRREREPVYDSNSKIVPNVYRNRWEIERVQFIQQRAANAHKVLEDHREARREGMDDPSARALYMIMDGAERLAAVRFPNPEDRQRFIAGVQRAMELSPQREVLIGKIAERLPANIQLKGQAATAEGAKEMQPAELARKGFARE